jgi:prolyl-tRNA synthetase
VLFKAVHADREEVVAVLVRGDQDVNPVKVQNAVGALDLVVADEETLRKVTGAAPGFAGPVGLPVGPNGVTILGDNSIDGMTNFLCGANETGHHLLDVNFGRDVELPPLSELRTAQAGDVCKRCGNNPLASLRGIEVGHVFKLGTKYSEAMGATFTDKDGKGKPFVMGCYGIGVSRIAAAAVEQCHDDKGIAWPAGIAPMDVVVVPMKMDDQSVVQAAEKLYVDLGAAGLDALLDDRGGRPGPKLKDAEIMGFPFRIICGRSLAEGNVEIDVRATGVKEVVPLADAVDWITRALAEGLAAGRPAAVAG